MTFLSLTAVERAQALCANFRVQGGVAQHASLTFGVGTIAGERCYLLAQDARYEGGSFGAAESDAVEQWLGTIMQQPAPIILMLDSGGARMSEGLGALGGFRRMFRAAADAWLANIPMLFVCGKTVFGGASMLASLGDHRIFFERSLYGMSGPRIVEAVSGAGDFNAGDKAQVGSVMGGAARAQCERNVLIADDVNSVRNYCDQWGADAAISERVSALSRLQTQCISQRQQLERDGLARLANSQLILPAQFPNVPIRSARVVDGILLGRTTDGGYLYGIVNGKWADSWDAWKLVNALITQAKTAPDAPVVLLLDCPAHATSRALEAGMISQYFALLGLAVRYLHSESKNVTLHIVGAAAGGVHVALAGGATRVIAHAGADIRILPRIAIAQVRADIAEEVRDSDEWIKLGVVDARAMHA